MSITFVLGAWSFWLGLGLFLFFPIMFSITLARTLYYVYMSKKETPPGLVYFLFVLQGIQHEIEIAPVRAIFRTLVAPVVLGSVGLAIGIIVDNFIA